MKREPQAKVDEKPARRPRPLTPASWLEEVKPDDDVMAVFYGRAPVTPPTPEPEVREEHRENTGLPVAQEPVSRETENRSPGRLRTPADSRSLPAGLPRETDLVQTGLPVVQEPVSRFNEPPSVDLPPASGEGDVQGEAHWPSRRYKARIQTRIPQTLSDDLLAYCERRAVTRDAAVERAIRLLLSEDAAARGFENRETGLPEFGLPGDRETEPAHHDHDDDHDDKIIMMIFERETGRRFRADERNLLAEFRGLDSGIVQQAIRYAVKYSKEPVGSFAYCAKVIRQRASRTKPSSGPAEVSPVTESRPTDDESLRYEIRTVAARLREAHRDDASYSHDRLVADVRSSFVANGREITTDKIETALRGLAM